MGKQITLVMGGAASGKSVHAEELVIQMAARDGQPAIYIATAQAFDAEMRAKIDIHIARRGTAWRTVEAPMAAAEALRALLPGQCCLLDCATLWLSNQMLAETDLAAAQADLLQAIAACPADLVIVTNEVGQGIVPDTRLGREFREAQGRLNIALAATADRVVQVIAGLPRVLKGTP